APFLHYECPSPRGCAEPLENPWSNSPWTRQHRAQIQCPSNGFPSGSYQSGSGLTTNERTAPRSYEQSVASDFPSLPLHIIRGLESAARPPRSEKTATLH